MYIHLRSTNDSKTAYSRVYNHPELPYGQNDFIPSGNLHDTWHVKGAFIWESLILFLLLILLPYDCPNHSSCG